MPNLMTRFIGRIALFAVAAIGQLVFTVRVLNQGGSKYWFLTIMVLGMFLNMAIVVYAAINGANRAQASSRNDATESELLRRGP